MLRAEVRVDEELEVLRERGEEHERRYRAHLEREGLRVVDGRYPRDEVAHLGRLERIRADADLTLRLMREGVDVIYQATLFDGRWRGYADFLLRTDGASDLGDHHYEVADTKLARKVKGSALLQMCVYSDLLARAQGRMPERMQVALGGSGNRVESERLDDYLAYYRSVKARFEEALGGDQTLPYPLPQVPPPVGHCDVCRWEPHCTRLRRGADHLSLVASVRSDQVRRLSAAGITTLRQLAELQPPLPEVDGIGDAAMGAMHQQARLQLSSRGKELPDLEFLPLEPNRGLAALPPPSRGDLFFDIEGDPFAEEDGLEYLFGVWDPATSSASGSPTFHAWWGHSRAEEKVAFEGFIDFVMRRWQDDPAMHVYHYAAYERGRMGMLSTRHGTREAEVDRILRCDLFVDLFKVVRQGMRIGIESYSIKKLEPLYALDREAPLKDAGSSVVAYERYIRSVSAGSPDQAILDQIGLYNQDDCRSTADLRTWLEQRRHRLALQLGLPGLPRLVPDEDAERPPSDRDARIRELADRLLIDVPVDAQMRSTDAELEARWLLANLLEWHRREEKVDWWAFFDRCSRSDEELASRDEEAIGQLTWVTEVDQPARSVVHRYAFDPEQPYRLKVGDEPVDPRTGRGAGKIVALDPLQGTLDLRTSRRPDLTRPTSLIPKGPVVGDAQKGALERLGTWVLEHGLRGPGPWRAARDFLLGELPRAGQSPGAALARDEVDISETARQLVLALEGSILPVQGPPGSGKTYSGAEMILALLAAGRSVGITAFTHRALTNLLDEVMEHATLRGISVDAVRKLESGEKPGEAWRYQHETSNGPVADALRSGSALLAAGTAWMWSRADFDGIVDTLFVDEAGQMSLANLLAVSGAARNLVLLGDPQQLSQVKKGAHPEGVDVSSLEHVLDGEPVIPGTRGLFLPITYRLHEDVNAFTSEAFYARQLRSAPGTQTLNVYAPGRLTGTGVRWIPVSHAGNRNSSAEEADVVLQLYADLLAGRWMNHMGVLGPLAPADILVVAPYNAQVELLRERLACRRGGPRRRTSDRDGGQDPGSAGGGRHLLDGDLVPG